MKLKLKDFDIEQIAESGECFRWNKLADNKYVGVIMEGVCIVEQNGEEVTFDSNLPDEVIKHYFDLSRDYNKIKEFLLKTKETEIANCRTENVFK